MTCPMRWKRTPRKPTMSKVEQALRPWFLQDPETDVTYMQIFRNEREGGWVIVVHTPAHMKNITLVGLHKTDKIALVQARAWWKANKEQHLQLFKD